MATQQFPQLSFAIDNPGAPNTIYTSANASDNHLTFNVTTNTNDTQFTPGTLVPPSQAPGATGSLLYLDLSNLNLTDTELGALTVTETGWTSQVYTDVQTICLTPTKSVTIAAGETISFAIGDFAIAAPPASSSVQLVSTYYRVENITFGDLGIPTNFKVLLQQPPDGTGDLHTAIQLQLPQVFVVVSDEHYPSVANSLQMVFAPGATPRKIVANDQTAFILTFVYADTTPGYGALNTPPEALNIQVLAGINGSNWTITPGTSQENPSWALQPPSGQPILGSGTASTVQFLIDNVVTEFQPGPTVMLVSYSNVPGFQDGSYSLTLQKAPHVAIQSFTASPDPAVLSGGSANVTLEWEVTNAGTLTIAPLFQDVTGKTSLQTTIQQSTSFTLMAQGTVLASSGNVANRSVMAEVLPVINSFDAAPSSVYDIDFPKAVGLTWNVNTTEPVTLTSSVTGQDPNQYQPAGGITKMINAPQMFILTPLDAPKHVQVARSLIVSAFQIAPQAQTLTVPGSFVASPPNAAYVAVSNGGNNQVSILSTATYQTLVPPIAVGASPAGMAFSADGSLLFVANSGDGTVSVIAVTATGTSSPYSFAVKQTVNVGGSPQQLVASPDGKYLYVTIDNGAAQAGSLCVLQNAAGTFSLLTTLNVGTAPRGVAVLPSGAQVFVAGSGNNVVTIIGVAGNGSFFVVNTIANVLSTPQGLAVTPDGSLLLVACAGSATVFGIKTEFPTSARKTFKVGAGPQQIAMSPGGDYAFVTNQSDGTVSVLSCVGSTVLGAPITVGGQPNGIAASADGGLVFAANGSSLNVLTLAQYQGAGAQTVTGAITDVTVAPDVSAAVGWANHLLKFSNVTLSTGVFVYSLSAGTIARQLTGARLVAFAYSPGVQDHLAYVTQMGESSVSVISTSTFQPVSTLAVPAKDGIKKRQPTRLSVSADGRLVFVLVDDGSLQSSVVVWVANLAKKTWELLADVTLFKGATAGFTYFCATPDGQKIFAVDSPSGKLWAATAQSGTYVVNTTPVAIGSQASAMAVSPDGSVLCILNKPGLTNFITEVTTDNLQTTRTYLTGNIQSLSLNGLVFSADGNSLLCSDGVTAGVCILDARSLRLVQILSQSVQFPFGIATAPDGSRIFTANVSSNNISVLQQVQPA